MNEELNKLKKMLEDFDNLNIKNVNEIFTALIKKLINQIEGYIGDYPTFIEPVYLEENVSIGDDVLLGPNVYIGKNCEIGDYVEISNAIIFDDVKVRKNIKIENSIIVSGSQLNFLNENFNKVLIKGISDTRESLEEKDL